jgi:hypothetical protein
MGIFDNLLRNRDGLAPQRKPNGIGHGDGAPLNLAERRELAELRQRRDALIRQEAAAERRLNELRAELDGATNVLLSEARTATEKSIVTMIVQFIAGRLPDWSTKSASETGQLLPMARAFRADAMAKLQPSAPVENLRARQPPPPPSPIREVEKAVADPLALASSIVEAGRKAQNPDGVQRPFVPGPRQPKAAADADDPQALAESIVKNGKRFS